MRSSAHRGSWFFESNPYEETSSVGALQINALPNYASEALRGDEEVVFAAVTQDGRNVVGLVVQTFPSFSLSQNSISGGLRSSP